MDVLGFSMFNICIYHSQLKPGVHIYLLLYYFGENSVMYTVNFPPGFTSYKYLTWETVLFLYKEVSVCN